MIGIIHVIGLAIVKTITDVSTDSIFGKLGMLGYVLLKGWEQNELTKIAGVYLSIVLVVLSITLKAIQIYKELKNPKKDEN